MLKFLSKQQRARNALLIFFCFVMVASLVIFFGVPLGDWIFGSGETTAGPEATAVVAEVDGAEITARELQQALSRISQGGQNLSFAKSFSDELLNQLITQRVAGTEAKRLGFTVTDEELRKEIARQVPNFVDDKGRFISFDRYRRAIEGSGTTVEEFEDSVRKALVDQKLRTYVTSGVDITAQEVEEDFIRQNTTANLVYVVIDPKKMEERVTVTDDEVSSYFSEHKDEFKITEMERKVDYLYIPYEALQKTVAVTDDEIRQEYDRTKTQQTIGATVSQIVFPFNETNEAEIRLKADQIVKKARGDDQTPAEDFAALGGKSIGSVTKEAGDTSYKQRVFSLSEAQKNVTEPVKEGDAFYVLKATQWNRKSLAQARPDLLKQLKERKARSEATTLATEMKKKLEETKDLRAVAEEYRGRLGNAAVDHIVRQTGFFAPSDQLPEFDKYSSSFTSSTSNLTEKGQVGNQVYLEDGLAIPQLADKRDPHDPTLEEVKDRVAAAVRKKKAQEQALQRAQNLVSQAASTESLSRIARAEGLDLLTQDDFKRGSILKDLEQSDQLEGFAFNIEAGKSAPQPIKVGDSYVLLGVTSRVEADLTKLATEREATRKRLQDQRRNQFYQAYLQKIKDRLAEEGRIIVYQKVFDSIAAGGGDIRDLLNITPGQP